MPVKNLFSPEPSEISSEYEDNSVVLDEENNEEKDELNDIKGKGKIGEGVWRHKHQQPIEGEVKEPEYTESKLQPTKSFRRRSRKKTLEWNLRRIVKGKKLESNSAFLQDFSPFLAFRCSCFAGRFLN